MQTRERLPPPRNVAISDTFMLVTCACDNCSKHLEFDPADAGSVIRCPHCGLETKLFIPGAQSSKSRQPVTVSPSPPRSPVIGSNLVTCPDCGNSVSKLADSCPKCGRPIVKYAHDSSQETRGRDNARIVKIVSALGMVLGIFVGCAAATTESSFLGAISVSLLVGGFFGFVVGRFME